ncbi:MAG: PQ loop repeat-domain-containing protein [Benjaminiella poitrasii]|nr:MAG: PQ loop repeat-domain-containing protein [Benjaminiella poitrasii]
MNCALSIDDTSCIQWIYKFFGFCACSYTEALGILLGYVSIFCWLNAQIPQMIENYRSQSAEGLSLYLLYFWLAGDIGNMISCILNHQMPFQIYLSIYFVLSDIVLIYQYFQFHEHSSKGRNNHYNKINEEEESILLPPEDTLYTASIDRQYGSIDKTKMSAFMGLCLFGFKSGLLETYTISSTTLRFYSITNSKNNSNLLPSVITMTTTKDTFNTLGCILAWICTLLYVMSRIPQIYKNHRRRSTEGISVSSFFLAVCGNLTYAASVLICLDHHTREKIIETLPYLVGSLGILLFDAVIFGQFLYYRS